MGDVLDEIMERLSPSALEFITEHHGDNSLENVTDLDHLLIETQSIRTRQTVRELQRKCLELKSKTAENSNLLAKLENDLKRSESLIKWNENLPNVETLMKKIHEYNIQIAEAGKHFENVNCVQLFNDVETHHEEIEKLRKKLAEVKKKYSCFEGIPPNLEEAKKAIAELKERIKCHEKKIDSLL